MAPRSSLAYSSVGLEFVLSVVVGLFGGRWLDGKLHSSPWLTVVGLVVGIFTAFRALWRVAKQLERDG